MAATKTRRQTNAGDLTALDNVRTVVWGERLPDFRFDPHAREPGAVLYVRDEWQRKVSALRRRATVRFPGRIHMGMLDPSTTPCVGSHSYGGGIGVSVDALRSTATVWATDDAPADGARDPVHLHYLRLFQELVGSDHAFDCKVQIDPRVIEHAGLGSSAAVGVALLAGLNHLCGAPFTDDELANIYLLNYVEAVGARKVFHRVTTGVALATLGGGLVGVGAGFSPLRRMKTDRLYATLAIVARSKRVKPPARPDPVTFRPELPKKLFRAMAADDRDAVLRLGQCCAEQNTRRVASTYGVSATTSRLLEIAERHGVSVFGVTSDGPSVFALSPSRALAQQLANEWLGAGRKPKHVIVSSVGRGMSCA